jgi:formamidopyrimidine-DNA glycosylase
LPELPEVETVRRGLLPHLEGARIDRVVTYRPDLRFAFPANFQDRIQGTRVERLGRRGKYLLGHLSTGETLVAHLGMSGRFVVDAADLGRFVHAGGGAAHTHVRFDVTGPRGPATIRYEDPRRFGFMDLVATVGLDESAHFAGMGPEPLAPEFSAAVLQERLRGRSAPLKSALLDQRVVAGLGNIYVCEALHMARLSPRRKAGSVGPARAARLHEAIVGTLEAAIAAGGSSLRDYAAADGSLGRFQHGFRVYGREGAACPVCATAIRRIGQAGRSTFHCPVCQR